MYAARRQVLDGRELKDTVLNMMHSAIADHVTLTFGQQPHLDRAQCREMLRGLEGLYFPKYAFKYEDTSLESMSAQDFIDAFCDLAQEAYEAKETEITPALMRELERVIMLRVVDEYWMEHIDAMDYLELGIRFRAYATTDSLIA